VVREAKRQIMPATQNPDGTMTHYVSLGFSQGQIDLMRFFPGKLLVRPGDTVKWALSPSDEAPHTVTFLNGEPEPGLVAPVFYPPSGPLVLYINPAVLFPSSFSPMPLTRSGLFNSGLLDPTNGPTSYSWVIGDITPGPLPYLCMLHDTSGMRGTLIVLPK
jgi:plastocyanin